jgi:hypothetical protein
MENVYNFKKNKIKQISFFQKLIIRFANVETDPRLQTWIHQHRKRKRKKKTPINLTELIYFFYRYQVFWHFPV